MRAAARARHVLGRALDRVVERGVGHLEAEPLVVNGKDRAAIFGVGIRDVQRELEAAGSQQRRV